MQISLGHHGIQGNSKLSEVLTRGTDGSQSVGYGELMRGRFFVDLGDEELWASYRSNFNLKIRKVIEDAEAICRHEFDLLGSGSPFWGNPIDWHLDPVSGYRWPKKFFFELKRARNGPHGSDIKIPWELSRMQHLPTLGKAYRLTTDERYAREIVEQITHWMDDNPCPYGVNWTCPMDVAIRIMNIIWAYLLIENAGSVTNGFRTRLVNSIFQHGQFILFNLERGVRDDGSITNGNHYLANIVGLLHLGLLCPGFKMAETWRRIGTTALVEEMSRQVHPDGWNFESSVSYHRLVLEMFTAGALLCSVNGVTLPDNFWARLERMFEFVMFISRPDGKVPQVGDADDGRLYILSNYGNWDRNDFRYLLSVGAVLFNRGDMKAHSGGFSEDAFWLLGPSGVTAFDGLKANGKELGSKAFPDSGLYVMRQGDSYLLACCSKVGTNGLGNHKHNDLLSFELYAGDKAFIIDPGTYVYTRNPDCRNLFRSTSYHNTVVIDRQEQNNFDPSRLFSMNDDSTLIVHRWTSTPETDRLTVEHTGYTRFTHPVYHRRTFLFDKEAHRCEITDYLTGFGDHIADWFIHFDHGIEIEPVGECMFYTRSPGSNIALMVHSGITLEFRIADGWVSRKYGHKLPAKILHISRPFNSACQMVLTIQAI